jgi:hypothetical protein
MTARIAPTLFEARLRAAASRAAWLRTPPKCPRSANWTAKGAFQGLTAVDGTPVGASRTLTDELRCKRS